MKIISVFVVSAVFMAVDCRADIQLGTKDSRRLFRRLRSAPASRSPSQSEGGRLGSGSGSGSSNRSTYRTSPGERKTSTIDPNVLLNVRDTLHTQSGGPHMRGEDCTYNYCQKLVNYPVAEVEAAIKKSNGKYAEYFAAPVVVDVAHRTHIKTEFSLCDSWKKLIYPEKIDNKIIVKGKVSMNYQAIEVEECMTSPSQSGEDRSCKYATFSEGYTAKCKQQYIVRRLLTFDNETKTVEPDDFKMPSCCVCMVKPNNNN